MAFLKLSVASVILGGGIGYCLLKFASSNESEIIKHLPPHSSQQHNLFENYKQKPEEFMSQGRLNINSKEYKPRDSTNVIEK